MPHKTEVNPWKTISSKTVYQNRFVHLREDDVVTPDGSRDKYTVFVPATGFGNVVIPVSRDGMFYLVGIWRYPTNRYSIEFPGGGRDDGEDSLGAARRELKEEAGIVSPTWTKLGSFTLLNGYAHVLADAFLAENAYEIEGCLKRMDAEAISDRMKVSLHEIFEMIQDGRIHDSLTLSALFLYLRHAQVIKC